MKNFSIGCIVIMIGLVALAAFEGWIVSLLWNWLAPLFWSNAPILTIWQAWGVLMLINIVFSLFKKK